MEGIVLEIREIKADFKEALESVNRNAEELEKTKQELKDAKDEIAMVKKESMLALQRLKDELKDPPYTFACGSYFDDGLYVSSQVIPYTKLFYSSTNVEGAGLEIETGVFTAGHPGSYMVSWSTVFSDDYDEPNVDIYLRKNSQLIVESKTESYLIGASGRVGDSGSKTLILHLERGETLDLYCDDCTSGIYFTTFCVSLSQFDVA